MQVIAENKKEYIAVGKLMQKIMTFTGFCYLIFSVQNIILNFHSFANVETLHKFIFAPMLTILFLPFVYFLTLYMIYDTFYVRIEISNKNKKLINPKIIALLH